MRYLGEKCPLCGVEFTEDDDIVVCPDCGTPHHRECYMSENRCANEELHAEGWKWERKIRKHGFRTCQKCHFPNKYTDTVCSRCGAELSDISVDDNGVASGVSENGQQGRDSFSVPDAEELLNPIKFLGLDPDEDMGGATMKEISDFVGTSAIYYIPKFKQMKDGGAKPTFNLFSLVFPSLFFANRKMWGWAVVAAILSILFNLPENLLLCIESLPEDIANFLSSNKPVIENVSNILIIADMAVRAVFCFFANWFYFRFSLNSLKKFKKMRMGSEDIKAAGGVKPFNMVLIMLIKYGIGVAAVAVLYMGFEMITTVQDFSTLCLH
ncbi:MAG: hypothetical protein J6U00_10530 [Ruminococcus sp.]|uniref:RING finger protein n=1 Tax=Ruminococcus sp. TaxID=41978 RepID=UPI001B220C16|nr:RING finger protein [Ruminococcus sp.]MBO7474412.1 hypothetical protein [Ruminococcus sp.]